MLPRVSVGDPAKKFSSRRRNEQRGSEDDEKGNCAGGDRETQQNGNKMFHVVMVH